VEGERELLGGSRVLLAPESEEGLRVDGPADDAQPVDAGVATPAEADQQRQAGDAGAAMVHDQGRGGKTGLRSHPAEGAIAAEHGRPVAPIAAPVMLFAGVAGGADVVLS
jgi:hypothetical protein